MTDDPTTGEGTMETQRRKVAAFVHAELERAFAAGKREGIREAAKRVHGYAERYMRAYFDKPAENDELLVRGALAHALEHEILALAGQPEAGEKDPVEGEDEREDLLRGWSEQASRSASPAPPSEAETCWLVERGPNEGQLPHIWWTGLGSDEKPDAKYGGEWTEDANSARRFPTKAAAEEAAAFHFGRRFYAVREHVFLRAAPQAPHDVERARVALRELSERMEPAPPEKREADVLASACNVLAEVEFHGDRNENIPSDVLARARSAWKALSALRARAEGRS